ncbi:MAG: T9SS type A sorting domain-containing protein [Syntrophaceae bacterium]|nr:T9SS type A sorting domain-containing protein [Syntrophaceae bacterium]
MKYNIATLVLFFQLCAGSLSDAQTVKIGAAWEFNQDGAMEGWTTIYQLSDMMVSGGTLKAKIADSRGLKLGGPEFNLNADEYGFLHIRMRMVGSESRFTITWRSDSTSSGTQAFLISGDGLFHEYEIPLVAVTSWKGQIQQMSSLSSRAPAGTEFEIDYIRIVHLGVRQEITSMKPLRTVLKQGQPFPFTAIVKNTGDEAGFVHSCVRLAPGFDLVDGTLENDHGMLQPGKVDTVNWMFCCNNSGDYALTFRLFSDMDTLETAMELHVVDSWFKLDQFFLSAWSPPAPTSQAYDYYAAANFDQILYLPVNESAVSFAESYHMRCQVQAGDILGQIRFLVAWDNKPPEALTPEILKQLDPMIEQFKASPAVWGYYLTDEPNAHAFENLGKTVAYLRAKDPTRLSYINLFPTYAKPEQLGTASYEEHVERFIDTVKPELLSYDHYHFKKDDDGDGYFNNLGIISKWARRYDIPFCIIMQAIGAEAHSPENLNLRIPSPGEHRWLVYSSLAYGARGIVWFLWDHPWGVTGSSKRDQLYASISQLNREITALGPVLLALDNLGAWHTRSGLLPIGARRLPSNSLVKDAAGADLVVGLFSNQSGKDFIMLMNNNYVQDITSTITLNRGIDDLKAFDVASGLWNPVDFSNSPDGAQFDISIQAGGGILYAVGAAAGTGESPGPAAVTKFGLEQNYPNPFNLVTTIDYHLAYSCKVRLAVYDILGRRAAVLLDERQEAGNHRKTWSADQIASGIYLYTLHAGSAVFTRKMMVLK